MSLVFSTVDVAAGPTVGVKEQVKLPMFPSEDKDNATTNNNKNRKKETGGFTFGADEDAAEKDDVSSDSSSIGAQSSSVSSEDRGSDGQDEAESKPKDGSLGSFISSLEESLPIKRGLSNYFSGKSKSFASLSECANANAGDIAKPENPFNKRRRILMSCKTSWSRRASCSSLISTQPPLLSPDLAVEEGSEEEDEERGGDRPPLAPNSRTANVYHDTKISKGFKPPRSFSLFDLGHV